jgi:hypothetical protein
MTQVLYKKHRKLARHLVKMCGMTPRRLGQEKEEAKRLKVQPPVGPVSFNEAFFLYYPEPNILTEVPEEYAIMREFFVSTKPRQREILKQYLSVPEDGDFPKVVRPVKHSMGRDFYVAHSQEELDHIRREKIKGPSYYSSYFQAKKEYRVIFVYGVDVVCVLKSMENAEQEGPRNHAAGARFLAVQKDINNKLLKTSFYTDMEALFCDYPFDLLAVDIGWHPKKGYVVYEVNFCPEVSVEGNLNAIKNQIERGRW